MQCHAVSPLYGMQIRAHKRMLIVPKPMTDRRCKQLASTDAHACTEKSPRQNQTEPELQISVHAGRSSVREFLAKKKAAQQNRSTLLSFLTLHHLR